MFKLSDRQLKIKNELLNFILKPHNIMYTLYILFNINHPHIFIILFKYRLRKNVFIN